MSTDWSWSSVTVTSVVLGTDLVTVPDACVAWPDCTVPAPAVAMVEASDVNPTPLTYLSTPGTPL